MSHTRLNPVHWLLWVSKTALRSPSISILWSDRHLLQWVFATENFCWEKKNKARSQRSRVKKAGWRKIIRKPIWQQGMNSTRGFWSFYLQYSFGEQWTGGKALIWEMAWAYLLSFILGLDRCRGSRPPAHQNYLNEMGQLPSLIYFNVNLSDTCPGQCCILAEHLKEETSLPKTEKLIQLGWTDLVSLSLLMCSPKDPLTLTARQSLSPSDVPQDLQESLLRQLEPLFMDSLFWT